MFLALRELRRSKLRFGLLIGVTALLMFLILILQTFKVALVTLFVGAIQNQSAPVLVYDVDARRSLSDSSISADLEQRVRSTEGVAEVGRLSQTIVPVQVESTTTVASVIGFDSTTAGGPTRIIEGRTATAPGEAVASSSEFSLGQRITVLPGGLVLDVVGVSEASDLFASSVFVPYDTYLDAVRSANPDAGTPLPNALAVVPQPGVDDQLLVSRLQAKGDDVEALTRADAANSNPAVSTVSSLFNALLPLFGVVVPLVTGAFFVVITAQKAMSLTLLRAIGAPNGRLLASLLAQVVSILAAGLLIGTALYGLITRFPVAGADLPFQVGAVAFWATILLALGCVSALFAARQVLRIDPIAATTGAGVGR
jgi:putative ABC transport system permease protein